MGVQHVNNITSTMHRQQLDNNTMQINIAQGHNSQGMPIITMHQPINLGPQVQNVTTCYQSSLPSTSNQSGGQNVQQPMHASQPTTCNGQ